VSVLRVVSWNVHGLHDERAAVHRVLRDLDGDVVCLQEAPSRWGSRVRTASLARASGLHFVHGARPAAGDALLVSPRVHVDECEALRLPSPRWRRSDRRRVAGVRLPEPRIGQQRGAVVATVRLPGTQALVVACVHLGQDAVERVRHARVIVELARRRDLPAVVAGDLNEEPGSPAWAVLAELAADPEPGAGPTFPARNRRLRIDAVLVSPALTLLRYGDGGANPADVPRGSDHWPVVADIEVPAEGSAPGPS
jgi:endonuclease/exonuclease/phosphatase family metal-dependent hydrolase